MTGSSKKYEPVEAADFEEFEWHEAKRAKNWDLHEVDFEDAKLIFTRPHALTVSVRGSEERWLAVGVLGDVEITVVYTMRNDRCRIISARRARHDERRAYHEAVGSRPKKGQN
jgi:uncharacterized protein